MKIAYRIHRGRVTPVAKVSDDPAEARHAKKLGFTLVETQTEVAYLPDGTKVLLVDEADVDLAGAPAPVVDMDALEVLETSPA